MRASPDARPPVIRSSRFVITALAASLLAACAATPPKAPPPPAPQAPEPPPPPAPAPSGPAAVAPTASELAQFQGCIAGLRAPAIAAGVSDAAFSQYAAGVVPDMGVLPLLDRQPEFSMPVWDYMAVLVDAERVADGRAAYQQWLPTLRSIEQQYGVDPAVVVGVWGVESNFGRNLGGRPLLQSLATLSCYGRRQAYFRTEFAATLRILQEGHVPAEKLNGSWAGAFGQTQFMPSTFLRNAVDFDGDGRRDIVSSVPDALASTANFLRRAGYRSGEPWGYEVQLPAGFDDSQAGRRNKRDLAYWRAQGITLTNGAELPDTVSTAGLLLPAGTGGPAFLVGRNFDTLYSYNASENYALAIAHLSDLVTGNRQPGFATAWPTDDPVLSRAENRALQSLLQGRGHTIGEVDGMIGARTRDAIRIEQSRLGMRVDGRAGQRLLAALRAAH